MPNAVEAVNPSLAESLYRLIAVVSAIGPRRETLRAIDVVTEVTSAGSSPAIHHRFSTFALKFALTLGAALRLTRHPKGEFAMKGFSLTFVSVVLLAIIGTSPYSHSQSQNQAPLPVRSRADQTLERWNDI